VRTLKHLSAIAGLILSLSVIIPACNYAANENIRGDIPADNNTLLKPSDITVGSLNFTPTIPESGQVVIITANITNYGDIEGMYPVTLKADNIPIETKKITISPKASAIAEFSIIKDAPGAYIINLGDTDRFLLVSENGNLLPGLKRIYPELYEELLKLPDLKEISENDKKAIERIATLAQNPKNKPAFEAMFAVGIKNSRKYCSPLQALFWLAYDKDVENLKPVNDFFIDDLLWDGWKKTTTSHGFSGAQWTNFDEVVDRLNSPELIEFYLRETFTWEARPKWTRDAAPAKNTFNDRAGACMDHAAFSAYCLKLNGYGKVYGLEIRYDTLYKGFLGHVVCVFQNTADNEYYVIDSFSDTYSHGPYKTIDEAANITCMIDTFGEAKLLSFYVVDINLNTGTF